MHALLRSLIVVVPLVLLAVLAVVYLNRPQPQPPAETATGQWTCSMHPQIRRPGPGQCPICGMTLVPVESLSSEQEQLQSRAGIEVEPVTYRELFKELRTVGKLDYNERLVEYITARIAGRVDKLYVDFTGVPVKKGDHLVDIYSPDLFIAQTELLRAKELLAGESGKQTYAQNAVESARTRLRLLGILPEQLAEIEKTGKARTHLTIYSPLAGTVIEKNVRVGQYPREGDLLYRIANLDPIWLFLDVYEYDLAWVRTGQQVDVSLEAYPGQKFRGTIVFIDPFLDDKTRSVKVRVNLKNPDQKLKPAMYANAAIRVRLRSDGTPEPTGLEGKYICPMHPEVIRDNPGKCPICEMPLERVPDTRAARANAKKSDAHDHSGHVMDKTPSTSPASTQVLSVRATAVLNTGRRTIVYRRRADGAYELVDVVLGPRADAKDDTGRLVGYYPVLKGLEPGDEVVARGGFLLDSQRQIEGMPSLLYPEGQSAANLHTGHGGAASAPPAAEPHKH